MESANVSARQSKKVLTAVHPTATGVINNKEFLKNYIRYFQVVVELAE